MYGQGYPLLDAALPRVGTAADLRRRGLAPWAPKSVLSPFGRAREGTSGSDATLGCICLGLESLPSPTDRRLIADEDDVHRCGRCQAEFTALEDFVQHKLQKVCQRVPQEALPATTSAAALLGQEVASPYCHCTRACPPPCPSADSRMRRWRHVKTDLCHRGGQRAGIRLWVGDSWRCSGLSRMAWDAGPLSSLWLKPAQLGSGVLPFLKPEGLSWLRDITVAFVLLSPILYIWFLGIPQTKCGSVDPTTLS